MNFNSKIPLVKLILDWLEIGLAFLSEKKCFTVGAVKMITVNCHYLTDCSKKEGY